MDDEARRPCRRCSCGRLQKGAAVIVQIGVFPESHASVIVCQLTSELSDAPDFRITLEPNEANGLRVRSQIMADKPVTVRRARIRKNIGALASADITHLNVALAFAMGFAD